MELTGHSEICRCEELHGEAIARARSAMGDAEIWYALSNFFKVMSDSTRMRIMAALEEGELCVCDLAEVLSMTKSAVSHQLKVLKDAQLVKFRRDGKNVFYALKDNHVRTILAMGLEHIKEQNCHED